MEVGAYCDEIDAYPIDFTAVDECADAFVRLALNNKVNNIYHMYNPDLFSIGRFGKKCFVKLDKVSREDFEKKVREKISEKDVAILSFYSTIASASANVPMSNEFTLKNLKKLGFKWSRINLRYLSFMRKLK